jgi:O-antigen biosynthesis protein
MPQVLVLSGVLGDTRRYRTFHLYEQLRLAGVQAELSHLMDPALLDKASWADLVIIHRSPFDGNLKRLFELVEKRGGLLIHDVDDLVFDLDAFDWIDSPDFQDPVRAALYREDLNRNRQTLERCAAVTASTAYLAERVRVLGKPAWVHRNAFSLEMLAQAEKARAERPECDQDRVVIGYASGTLTHNRDFGLVRPVLSEVLRRFPQVEVHLAGPLDPGDDWAEVGSRVKRLPLVPWRSLPARLAAFDINLAPLISSNPFAHSKSEIKFMEAAMVGVPTIATPTDAFAAAICSGDNGILADNAGEWAAALDALISDPQERRAMGQRAYTDVLQRYHPAVRAGELIQMLDEICVKLRGYPLFTSQPSEEEVLQRSEQPAWSSQEHEAYPTMAEMAWYNLRQRGLRTLAGRGWVFFRRLAAPLFPFKPRSHEQS